MNEPAAFTPDPAAAEEIEALMLAGELDAAVARLAKVAPESRDDPAIARLRFALHIAGRRSVGCDLEHDARLIVPGPGRPPPDLVALMSGLGPSAPIAHAAEAERRIVLAAARGATREIAAGRTEVARDMLRQALASNVPTAQGFKVYGQLLGREQRPTDAAFAYQRAVDFDPSDRVAQLALARALLIVGYHDDAAEAYRQGIEDPRQQRDALSCRLLAMVESSAHDDAALREAHRAYAATVPALPSVARPGRRPSNRLRIGFLWTPTNAAGAVLLRELLTHRTPERWRALLYVQRASVRFKSSPIAAAADAWTVAHALDDAALASKIAEDEVDLLIDLNGHGMDGRVGVLDHRPALVHASWISYPWALGHPAASVVIGDRFSCPDGTAERIGAPVALLPIATSATSLFERMAAEPPNPARRPFTFGCSAPPGRIQSAAIEAWARVMAAVPDARLRMAHRDWGMGMARNRLRYVFMQRGVDEKRIDFESSVEPDAEAAHWRQIDVALDSVPTGYMPATLHAIAADVPLVTMDGDRIVARHGPGAMRLLGLDNLVARDIEGYARIAARLAKEAPTRETVRQLIENRRPSSPLADGPGFARAFEALTERIVADAVARIG